MLSKTVKHCLSIFLSIFITTACTQKPDYNVSMRLQIDPASLNEGRVVIDATLINNSEHVLQFLPWNTPFDSGVSGRFIKVEKKLGDTNIDIPYQGRMMKRAEAKASDYVTLGANSLLSNQLDITKSYSFCANTQYIISFRGQFIGLNGALIEVNTSSVMFNSLASFAVCQN